MASGQTRSVHRLSPLLRRSDMHVPLMIGEGVFDRYPRLRVAFMEGGCGWIPFWAHRLDEHWEKLRPQWPELKREPSDVIKSEQVGFTWRPGSRRSPTCWTQSASRR